MRAVIRCLIQPSHLRLQINHQRKYSIPHKVAQRLITTLIIEPPRTLQVKIECSAHSFRKNKQDESVTDVTRGWLQMFASINTRSLPLVCTFFLFYHAIPTTAQANTLSMTCQIDEWSQERDFNVHIDKKRELFVLELFAGVMRVVSINSEIIAASRLERYGKHLLGRTAVLSLKSGLIKLEYDYIKFPSDKLETKVTFGKCNDMHAP